MNIVIVESPAKAKTINKYLGSDYEVFASYGHVRDLPSKNGSVDPDEDFAMSWAVDGKSSKRLADIAKAVKGADRLILATDPDREGEAISWHMLEVLRAKKALTDKPVQRVVFNAITRDAVLDAMKHPREIDADLVDAYLARRALDYLVGFTLSPVLWRKLPGARSAGRVQSVALRLVCDRENEIEIFVPREYWSVAVTLETVANAQFVARVVNFDGKRITRLDIPDETMARRVETALKAGDYRIASIEAKPVRRNPPPPFTTSTLQQEASRKLGFSSARTMQVAQRLYEDGRITYMRTDGVDVAPEALAATRATIGKDFGPRYVPEQARHYKVKAKNAQEAHEAIRPTDPSTSPASLRSLEADQARLYELIWKRLLASQMAAAEIERTTVEIEAGGGDKVGLRATGQVIRFDGFLTLYQEGRDEESDEDDANRLPPMTEGENLTERGIAVDQHFTEPPPRYTEATLIKKMEELGIGRPSTYTSTLSVLRDRDYVRLEKRQLIPEDKGRLVTAFLSSFFKRYVEYDFTAELEEKLDKISNGDIAWKDVLREFWNQFSADVGDTKDLRVSEVLEALNELLAPHVFPKPADGGDPRQCPSCATGKLSLKLGKFGAFIGCSNYPECRFTRQLATNGENGDSAELGADGVRELGQDPETGLAVTVRTGRFGPYLQLGEPTEEEKKPKRASLPKGWSPATIELEQALSLLALPREVGLHPETNTVITAGIGRYGPFVLHDGTYANLDSVDEVFSVGLNRAAPVLAEKRAGGGRGRGRATPKALKTLGDHPTAGGAITVRDGKYGPYVNHGKINATLPKDVPPEEVTMNVALELLAAKAKKGGAKPKATKAKTTKAKTTKAKTATKAKATKAKAKPKADAAEPAAKSS
ncbi:type I DNA topoisomerase [Bauldia litoralis]|uniref:type I DNA topoisomerase n=1 Tax=Bauldia litoralis TaxID=665467 RepID=UPI00329833BA